MTGFGGMVTFFIKGDLENAKQFFKSSKVYFCYLLLLVERSNSQRQGSAIEIDATKRCLLSAVLWIRQSKCDLTDLVKTYVIRLPSVYSSYLSGRPKDGYLQRATHA